MNPQLDSLKFDSAGLIPAIIQDHKTHEVLMMAWMNRQSLELTIQTGKTHFFSRSRNRLWLKGEESGHIQRVRSIRADCDKDCLLIEVEQVGAACHEGYFSCFHYEYAADQPNWTTIGQKLFDPEKVYRKG